MITKEQIKAILAACKKDGHSEVTIKDISFLVLKREYKDSEIAFKQLFHVEPQDDVQALAQDYEKSDRIQCLRKHMNNIIKPNEQREELLLPLKEKSEYDITFEENKAEILKSIARLEAMKDDPTFELDAKTLINIEGQLLKARTTLNDKFGTAEENDSHFIIVQHKFNSICACGREIYIPTKEDLMEKYNLVEKNSEEDLEVSNQ